MGWIYGNTIVDTNNSIEIPSYQYDKIFSNYFLARNTETVDNVFLGRKILVDYNQDLTDTLTRVHTDDGAKYYYWRPDGKYTDTDLVSIASIAQGTYVYTKTLNQETNIEEITFLQCTSSSVVQNNNDVINSASLTEDNDLQTFYIGPLEEGVPSYKNKDLSTYEFNLRFDKEHLSQDKSYDSTVWQKVSVGNNIKYVMIAELNAKNPVFNLVIKPPLNNGVASAPAINIESEDAYKLVLSSQPGFRINDQSYKAVHVYRPGAYRYRDENGLVAKDDETGNYLYDMGEYDPSRTYCDSNNQIVKIYAVYEKDTFYINTETGMSLETRESVSNNPNEQYYVHLSDERVNQTYYNSNNELQTMTKPGAIYYNKAGLNKEIRSHVDFENEILFEYNGRSGYEYPEDSYYEIAHDITNQDGLQAALQGSLKDSIYYMVENDSGYWKVNTDDVYKTGRKYYYKKLLNDGKHIDTNQLSIYLPAIGNMVSEGWDKIYGEDRKQGEYQYDPHTNTLYDPADGELNDDVNSIVGLLNNLKEKTKEIRGYSDDSIAHKVDVLAKSLQLKETETTVSTGDGASIKINSYIPLQNTDIIQNQIAINNLGIQQLADKIGLDYNADVYVEVPNVTEESYQPNLYYYKTNEGSYELSKEFAQDETYYTCRIDEVSLKENHVDNLQKQIDDDCKDLEYRRQDLRAIVNAIGLANSSDFSKEENAGITLDNNPENKNTIQGQINRNDADIANLLALIGITRNDPEENEIEGAVPQEIQEKTLNEHLIDLYNDNIGTDGEISNIARRIRAIEDFLSEGFFLFTHGRSNIDFTASRTEYPIPGDNQDN